MKMIIQRRKQHNSEATVQTGISEGENLYYQRTRNLGYSEQIGKCDIKRIKNSSHRVKPPVAPTRADCAATREPHDASSRLCTSSAVCRGSSAAVFGRISWADLKLAPISSPLAKASLRLRKATLLKGSSEGCLLHSSSLN